MTRTPSGAPAAAHRERARPRRASVKDRIAGIYRSRRILKLLILRDLKEQYSEAALGYLWTVLDPLVFSITFWFLFTQILKRGNPGEQPFIVWLLLGMIPFNWTRSIISGASRILESDSKLIVSASVPREVWVLKTVTTEFLEFLFALPVIAAVVFVTDRFACTGTVGHVAACPAFHPGPNVVWLLLPVAILVQFVLNIGLGLGLAPLGTLYLDVDKLLKLFAQLYRFITPVIYSIMLVPQVWHGLPMRRLFALNPLVGVLGVYHGMFFTPGSQYTVSLHFILAGLAVAAVLAVLGVIVGWRIFISLEPEVLKDLA